MKYTINKITIGELIKLYESKKIDLNPPYQRNEIWSTTAKKLLIDSINKNFPLPNFFIRLKEKSMWEMVDGQQRTRAILGFYYKDFATSEKITYDIKIFPNYLKYELATIFISDLERNESIEDFYVRVNSTGVKLNRPELKKAEYFETKFLKLLEELAGEENLVELDLFTESTLNRMNDIDFISELVALLEFGITEKKDFVDKLFESDIDSSKYKKLKNDFISIIDTICFFNSIYKIKKTRYKQRNDFYTLFGFLKENNRKSEKYLTYVYKTLVLIDNDISPSNEDCIPFQDYALNCVSQSNSKQARKNRYNLYNNLFLNNTSSPNDEQLEIMEYYELEEKDFEIVSGYLLLDIKKLQSIISFPIVIK